MSLIRRAYPTYYLEAHGEVDIAYVKSGTFWPIEIKWRRQLRTKDLKLVATSRRGRIWARTRTPGEIDGVPVEPLPLALYEWDGGRGA